MLITGVGTGGHITACAEVLKGEWPELKVFAVEPTLSPVLSGGDPGPHPIQGIGAGFIPAIMDTSLLDGIIQVDPADAKEMARRAAREEGMLVGISSGATLAAIAQKLAEIGARQARARLQLRHRRALPLGAGLPAGGMSARIAILTPDPGGSGLPLALARRLRRRMRHRWSGPGSRWTAAPGSIRPISAISISSSRC